MTLNSSTGGNLSVTIGSSADLLISTSNNHVFNGSAITNGGTVTWTSGYIGGGNGSVFTNNGTFHDQNNGSNSSFLAPSNFGFGGSSSFTNNGTVTWLAGYVGGGNGRGLSPTQS